MGHTGAVDLVDKGNGKAEEPSPLPTLNLSAGIAIPSKTNGGNGGNGKAHEAGSPRGNGGARPFAMNETVPTYAARGAGRLVRVHIQRTQDADEDIRRMRDLVQSSSQRRGK